MGSYINYINFIFDQLDILGYSKVNYTIAAIAISICLGLLYNSLRCLQETYTPLLSICGSIGVMVTTLLLLTFIEPGILNPYITAHKNVILCFSCALIAIDQFEAFNN